MSEEVSFEYEEGLFQDFIKVYQRLSKMTRTIIIIPITEYDESPFDYDEFDAWCEEIYEKCPERNIPKEYMTLDNYYKNPDDPKMTKNIHKYEFCSMKDNTDDYSCCFNECPKRSGAELSVANIVMG